MLLSLLSLSLTKSFHRRSGVDIDPSAPTSHH
jgi:hypothetical protein